jgi:hypothetical protein
LEIVTQGQTETTVQISTSLNPGYEEAVRKLSAEAVQQAEKQSHLSSVEEMMRMFGRTGQCAASGAECLHCRLLPKLEEWQSI